MRTAPPLIALDGLDTRALRQILVVARTGSMRAAADVLGLAPSAISRQVAALEEQLGVILFERTSRGVILAEAGRLVAEHARQRIDGEALLREQLGRIGGAQRNLVRITSGEGFIGDLIAHGLPRFRKAVPGARFSVRLAGAAVIVDTVVNGDADLGLVYHMPPDAEVQVIARACQPLAVVAPAGHPCLTRAGMRLAEALDHDFALLAPGSGVRQLVGLVATEQGLVLSPVLEAGSIDILRRFVAAGLGITFLPAFAVQNEIACGLMGTVSLDDSLFSTAGTSLIVRARKRLPDLVTRLADHLALTMAAFQEPAIALRSAQRDVPPARLADEEGPQEA